MREALSGKRIVSTEIDQKESTQALYNRYDHFFWRQCVKYNYGEPCEK